MAFEAVTKEYVDLITYQKYATRTNNTEEFEALKEIYCVYINTDTQYMPEKKQTHAMALLLAHYYALDDTNEPEAGSDDTSTGNITTERVGDLTQVRGTQPYIGTLESFKTWLMQSRYGVELIFLLKSFKPTPLVT